VYHSASFYILFARSLLVWYKVREQKEGFLAEKDGEEIEDLLTGENYV
jgi:hypothetical protein